MNTKKLLLVAFILVALAQLYVPTKMILNRENVLANGTDFKFRTAPIDPNDPFRGKYVNLQYENNVDLQKSYLFQKQNHWMNSPLLKLK